ncbi:MAG: GTPase Era [Methylacidiphilales bacterium]|nr:GTPase Era [Candidatus Methylacidiphilales bacterium]
MISKKYFGSVAIIGKTNVGKSSLFNMVSAKPYAGVTHKINTTNVVQFGITTIANTQLVVIDTPGIESYNKNQKTFNELLSLSKNISVIWYMVDSKHYSQEDIQILLKINSKKIPSLIIMNKIDVLTKIDPLQYINDYCSNISFIKHIVPFSTKKISYKKKILSLTDQFTEEVYDHPYLYDSEISNKQSIIHSVLREQLLVHIHQEIPYTLNYRIIKLDQSDKSINISILLVTNKKSHLPILVGSNGATIKRLGISIRKRLILLFELKIHLSLKVIYEKS